jgi:hypothetical protein
MAKSIVTPSVALDFGDTEVQLLALRDIGMNLENCELEPNTIYQSCICIARAVRSEIDRMEEHEGMSKEDRSNLAHASKNMGLIINFIEGARATSSNGEWFSDNRTWSSGQIILSFARLAGRNLEAIREAHGGETSGYWDDEDLAGPPATHHEESVHG